MSLPERYRTNQQLKLNGVDLVVQYSSKVGIMLNAQDRLYDLTNSFKIGQQLMVNGFRYTVDSVLTDRVHLHFDSKQESKASHQVGDYWNQYYMGEQSERDKNPTEAMSDWLSSSVLNRGKHNAN